MKNKVLKLIDYKINEIENEVEPSYCGVEVYNEWFARHCGKLEILEDLKEEIKIMSE